jgi:hypothetical protein
MDHLFSRVGLKFESGGTIVEGGIAVHAMFMASAEPPETPDFMRFS